MFRQFQNRINELSQNLAEVQNKIGALIQQRNDLARNPIGPSGNSLDVSERNRITIALSELYAEEDALTAELADVRLQLRGAMAMPLAA